MSLDRSNTVRGKTVVPAPHPRKKKEPQRYRKRKREALENRSPVFIEDQRKGRKKKRVGRRCQFNVFIHRTSSKTRKGHQIPGSEYNLKGHLEFLCS